LKAVVGVVGVEGAHGAAVAGGHGLNHVQGFAAADLADDDAVRSQAEAAAEQFADAHGSLAETVRRSGFDQRQSFNAIGRKPPAEVESCEKVLEK
jgi:hypothetical protein